jgi:hypothetical protein
MILYKLTDEHDRTFRETQWGEGVTHTAPGTGDLCTSGWIHAYHDPILALFLNPGHARFSNPHVWEAHGVVGMTDHGLKVGCTSLTTVRRIHIPTTERRVRFAVRMPTITTERRVRFAVRCALAVCSSDAGFRAWAVSWLSGANRRQSAAAAAEAAARAAGEAAWAAAAAAAAAAQAAAAEETWAAAAEAAAAWAAAAAEAAARAAGEQSLPLIEFAHWAVSDDQLPE